MNLHCGQQWVSNNNGKQNQNVADRNHAVDIYKPETEEFPKLRKPGQNKIKYLFCNFERRIGYIF